MTAFEVGWSVLYQDVSLFVADQLMSTLADLRCVDADTRHGLRALRRKLVKQRKAGTPWLARDAADVLAMLDMTAWISVLGLLDECPILPAALTAILDAPTPTSAVSPDVQDARVPSSSRRPPRLATFAIKHEDAIRGRVMSRWARRYMRVASMNPQRASTSMNRGAQR